MAPTSSNTVAKCVYGISDSLATNIFAQSGKCRVNCIFFPCDTAPELKTFAPSGYVDVFPREIDLENVKKLKKFKKTKVVVSFKSLRTEVLKREKCLKKYSS
jgi:flavoprotein